MSTTSPSTGPSTSVDPQALVQRGPGTFRVHTDAYTDPRVFELEMARIWSRTWVYVGHESEIPEPGNYKTSHIGLAPVIVSRGDDGGINVFYNRCRHRGSVVCREPRGFANSFRCPYHGWIYGKDGRLLGVSMRDGYPKDFDQPSGLLPVGVVESYKGLIFASASADVPDLKEQLGLAATWIDRRVGLSPVGEIELVSEPYVVEYQGNWKFQIENIIDEYHFAFVHEPFMKLQEKYGNSTGDYGAHVSGSVENMNQRRQTGRRSWGGVGGHGLGERQISDEKLDELLAGEDSEYYKVLLDQHGRDELRRMAGGGSVMTHPNLGMIHRQIRVVRPLSVDRTEVTIYPYEVKGAPASHNEGWLRSQERFYGPAGYGMPDDVEMFALNQQGLAAKPIEWLILERGLDREEVNERGDKSSPVGSETPLRALWEEWLKLMSRAS